jgi:hypothetical protein
MRTSWRQLPNRHDQRLHLFAEMQPLISREYVRAAVFQAAFTPVSLDANHEYMGKTLIIKKNLTILNPDSGIMTECLKWFGSLRVGSSSELLLGSY